MDKYERLQALLLGIKREFCRDNAAELARQLKRSDSYINRLFYPPGKNGAKGIGPEIMDACKQAFPLPRGFWDMTPEEAFSATQAERFGGRPVIALDSEDAIPDGVVLIPESVVRFSGGNGSSVARYEENEEKLPASYRRAWFVEQGMNPAGVKRFSVHGRSMETTLFDGDTILVNMAETEVRDGLVYAIRYGDEMRVKRLFRRLDGGLIIKSDNPDFSPEEVPPSLVDEHISIIGRVREKAGNGGLK